MLHCNRKAIQRHMREMGIAGICYEEVYLHDYATPREARQGLTRYFDFYNHERPHQALDYRTPAQVYFGREEAPVRSCHLTPPRHAIISRSALELRRSFQPNSV